MHLSIHLERASSFRVVVLVVNIRFLVGSIVDFAQVLMTFKETNRPAIVDSNFAPVPPSGELDKI